MNGFGKLKNENAEFYGYWKDDIHIDIGFETWIDFSNYFGEYKIGKKEGIETYIWSDKSKYEGEWKNNNLEGYGISHYPNGKKYILESGKIKKSMVMVNFIGMTEKNILVFIKKIKEKDLASIANLIK